MYMNHKHLSLTVTVQLKANSYCRGINGPVKGYQYLVILLFYEQFKLAYFFSFLKSVYRATYRH